MSQQTTTPTPAVNEEPEQLQQEKRIRMIPEAEAYKPLTLKSLQFYIDQVTQNKQLSVSVETLANDINNLTPNDFFKVLCAHPSLMAFKGYLYQPEKWHELCDNNAMTAIARHYGPTFRPDVAIMIRLNIGGHVTVNFLHRAKPWDILFAVSSAVKRKAAFRIGDLVKVGRDGKLLAYQVHEASVMETLPAGGRIGFKPFRADYALHHQRKDDPFDALNMHITVSDKPELEQKIKESVKNDLGMVYGKAIVVKIPKCGELFSIPCKEVAINLNFKDDQEKTTVE